MAAKKDKCNMMCCTTPPEAVERIKADLDRWSPGLWANLVGYGAACTCGLRTDMECARHPKSADPA